jgi:hypothetical protein
MKTQHYSTYPLRHSAAIASGAALAAAFILFASAPRSAAQSVWGNALSFDGVNDHLVLPPDTWFSSDFTVETWVYVRSYNNWSRVIDFGNGQYADNVLFALARGLPAGLVYRFIPTQVAKR